MRGKSRTTVMLVSMLAACGGSHPELEVASEAEASGGSLPSSPVVEPLADADADGVFDALDRCPAEAAPPISGGCPDYDEDGDGEPEHWSRYACDAGSCTQRVCHREPPAIPIVYFANDRSATGSQASTAALDAMAEVLRDHAEDDVFVTGHAAEAEREEVAQARAEWLVTQLARRGVDEARLHPAGFGAHWGKSEVPDGMNEAEASRRVELHVSWYGPPGCADYAIPEDKCPVACGDA